MHYALQEVVVVTVKKMIVKKNTLIAVPTALGAFVVYKVVSDKQGRPCKQFVSSHFDKSTVDSTYGAKVVFLDDVNIPLTY